jgi:VWFA-related protein
MKTVSGRKALIVLSDGMDDGSSRSVTDAIEAAQAADTLVYTIRYLGTIAKYHPVPRIMVSLSRGMSRLSEETGGTAFSSPKDPAPVFAEIENDLRNLYILSFTPPDESRDGKFHKLEIHGPKEITIRARKGYSIPPPALN